MTYTTGLVRHNMQQMNEQPTKHTHTTSFYTDVISYYCRVVVRETVNDCDSISFIIKRLSNWLFVVAVDAAIVLSLLVV